MYPPPIECIPRLAVYNCFNLFGVAGILLRGDNFTLSNNLLLIIKVVKEVEVVIVIMHGHNGSDICPLSISCKL